MPNSSYFFKTLDSLCICKQNSCTVFNMFNILFQLQDLFDLIQYKNKFECSSQIRNSIDIFKTVGNMYLNLSG